MSVKLYKKPTFLHCLNEALILTEGQDINIMIISHEMIVKKTKVSIITIYLYIDYYIYNNDNNC
jgi:hypothetical protein